MSHIKVYSDISTIQGYDLSFKPHANHAANILIGEESISVSTGLGLVKARGFIIKANTLHKLK